eukprot:jgi/Ulvmu1/7275/UM035_0063.1
MWHGINQRAMTKQEALEVAINHLLRNWEDAPWGGGSSGVRAQSVSGKASKQEGSSKHERPVIDPTVDFDRRLQRLVDAARSGGMKRGDQYRLEQAQPIAGDGYIESKAQYLDNLVFGAPYNFFLPAYDRGGWAGSADISQSFAQVLKKRRRDRAQVHDQNAQSFPRKRVKVSQLQLITSESHSQATRVKQTELDGVDLRLMQLDTAGGSGQVTLASSITHMTAQLSKATRESPNDVSAWLAYAAHQADAMVASGGKINQLFVAQKQADILEEALKHNPSSEALLAGFAGHVARELTDGGEPARHIAILQSLARDFPVSRAVWTELLGTVAQALDSEQESLDPTQEATASMPQLQRMSMQAIISLAKHAQGLLAQSDSAQESHGMQHVWRAECNAAEAIARHVQLEMSRGDAVHAVQLVQAACEWFSCPRVSWTTAHRRRWFRAFWESEAPRVGIDGAIGFTAWVDSQTLDWRQQQARPQDAVSYPISIHLDSMPRQVRKHAEEPAESDEEKEDSSSDGDKSDEVDALLEEEALREQYRRRIAAIKDNQHTPEFLIRFVEAEALKSSIVTGLKVMDDDQSDQEKEAQLRETWERVQFLQEFWPSGDACVLTLKATLATLGVSSHSISGPYAPALLAHVSQFSATSAEADLCRPMLLGDALGLLFPPNQGTQCGKSVQPLVPWFQVASFESLHSADMPHQTSLPVPWYAQSHERHRLVGALLKVLLSSQSRLAGDISTVRALFDVECTQVHNQEGGLEAEGVAGKRGHAAAKRWLVGNSENPQVWSAYAALEARRGRHTQALHALTAAMNDTVARGLKQLRWVLALCAICVEFCAAQVPLRNDHAAMASADPVLVREAAVKCMNMLMWAAAPRGQLQRLDNAAIGDPGTIWKDRMPQARAALQAEIAAAGRHMAALHQCPGSSSDKSEAVAAAVGCAMSFEVLGSICGVLPPDGWQRAQLVFLEVMGAVPESLSSIRQECHGWACMLATLASLERSTAAPQMQQDLQLGLLQRFPASPYLSYQTATLCAVTVMPARLRVCSRLLLRRAGPTAHPNLQLIPVVEACMIRGDEKDGRARLSRLLASRSQHRKKTSLDVSTGPLDALQRACFDAIQKVDCGSAATYVDCGMYSMSKLAVLHLVRLKMLMAAQGRSSNDALHLGISARHHFRWCKGVWLLSARMTANLMDDKDIRYFGEQFKWSGIVAHANFDELNLMFSLNASMVDVTSVT